MNVPLQQPTGTQQSQIDRALCMILSGNADQVDWSAFSSADWVVFSRMAESEAVAPLVYATLDKAGSYMKRGATGDQPDDSILPPDVKARLSQSYYHNAAFNTMLCSELDGIVETLTRACLPVILLKGASLVKTVYTDPAERPMNDLDILVRRANIRPAVKTLQAIGYQRLLDNYIRYHVLLLGGQAGNVSVELHWSLVLNSERYPTLIDWFWSQSQPLDPGKPCVRTLSPTAQLLYLAVHLALQHGGQERLIWYYDLNQLITRLYGHIDWEALLHQASQFSWAQPLNQALTTGQARLGFSLPDGFLERLQQQAVSQPIPAGRLVGSVSDRRSVSAAKTWGGLSLPDRLRMIGGLLFPRPAYLRWRYRPRPVWLWPLWYLRRWGDVLRSNEEASVNT